MMKQSWHASFYLTSFRRLPEPRAVIVWLKLEREPERRIVLELDRVEADRLAKQLAAHLKGWDKE